MISRKHCSKEYTPAQKQSVEKEYQIILNRNADSVSELVALIDYAEEISAGIEQAYSRANVAVTIDTTDQKAEDHLMMLVTEILPLSDKYGFEINNRILQSKAIQNLDSYYQLMLRSLRADVEIYREENTALKIEERKLVNEFEKIMGGMMVTFRGKELTMQQAAKYLEDPDEATRKEAFQVRAEVRLKSEKALGELYLKLLKVRHQMALNSGFKNFRDYQFKAWHRFDYTPTDCIEFHSAIEACVVPTVKKVNSSRIKKLGAQTLKPWNLTFNVESKKRIIPFETSEELIEGCRKIFKSVDTELGAYFEDMMGKKLLDLDSRKGKAPGGYCTHFPEDGVPFIFMNAAGTKRDVDTLLHEGGHSFHYYLARNQKLKTYHNTCLEFAEVASMSMELLSRPYIGEFYKDEEIKKHVLKDQLEKIADFFPFMAMIDAFQHWVYLAYSENQNLTSADFSKKWTELESRFRVDLDWSGFETVRNIGWQYPHVFSVPFYYIEYGIAQCGALSVWVNSKIDYRKSVQAYKDGLRIGASLPLPELFSAVGAKFGLNSATLNPLIAEIAKEIF